MVNKLYILTIIKILYINYGFKYFIKGKIFKFCTPPPKKRLRVNILYIKHYHSQKKQYIFLYDKDSITPPLSLELI